jgi:hypothetical protein
MGEKYIFQKMNLSHAACNDITLHRYIICNCQFTFFADARYVDKVPIPKDEKLCVRNVLKNRVWKE